MSKKNRMSKNHLSPYPPDRWIREMNRRFPSLWAELRKGYANPENILSGRAAALIHTVPDWCIMPTAFPFLVMANHYGEYFAMSHCEELMTVATTYTWRCSKGVYRFAPEIYEALVRQPLTGDLPQECLFHLPEWAVYVETPGLSYERRPLEGFIAHLDLNLFSNGIDLQFALFRKGIPQPKMIALPLGDGQPGWLLDGGMQNDGACQSDGTQLSGAAQLSGGTLLDAMRRVDQTDTMMGVGAENRYVGSRDEYYRTFSAMLQLLLYLCSDEPDMPVIEHPRLRRRFAGSVRPPEEPRVWDVGVRISSAIRRFGEVKEAMADDAAVPGTHASPRPHIRSAHWHTYWTGPRNGAFPERKPVLRWIPPLPIGMDWKRELPTNVRRVGG